ncbi:MAG: hypothetical protein IKA59_00830 [Clostridia bacterium]|nr:hypothetical protein [Clostridia bacterium]
MIFFLNLNGELTRQDVGRIFQGSTAVPDIKVLSYVSSDTGSLSVSFTLPNKLATVYYPLAIVGEHVGENGFKTYLWGIKADNEGIVKDLLGNVTQDVGEVGVSVRQTNTVTGEVVASYTASFNVEYSARPIPPSEATTDDIATLLDLLNAYYAQNQNLIDSIGRYNINERVSEVEEKVETLEEKVETLEEKTAVPVLVNITTDLETGIGTKYYSDGTTATFQIATDVTVVNRNDFLTEVSFATTSNWQLDDDGTYFIAFSPQTLDRTNNKCMAVIDKLDGNGVFQTGNGVFKGSDGTIILRGVTTPFDGKLLVLGGGSAGTKIWTGTTENGYESIDGALNGDYYLDTVTGNLYLLNNGIWTLLFSMRAEFPQRDANTNGSVYVLTPNGFETPEFEQLTVETADNVTFYIKVGGKTAGTITVPREIYLEDVTYNPETKTLSFIYNTESGKATIDIPLTDLEEVNNLLIVTTQSDFNDAVTSVNVGKVISYNSALYIVESVTENDTTTYRAKPYISLDEVTLFSTWQSTIEDLATENGDGITWTELSARVYAKNGVVSQPFRYEMRIPLIAGAGIEFEMSEDGQYVYVHARDINYNDLLNKPIINANLTGTSNPSTGIYYRHVGTTTETYTRGVIYYYDGTTFTAITGGGGGITDVQVNGTSVVADGVANIPEASDTQAGVVTTGAQTFAGIKQFKNITQFGVGSDRYSISAEGTSGMKFYRTENFSGSKYAFYGSSTGSTSRNITLDVNSLNIGLKINSTIHNIALDTTSQTGAKQSYLPTYTGTLMSAPETWSTGTSGTATLPVGGGLFEIVAEVYLRNTAGGEDFARKFSFLVNWDGSSKTESASSVVVIYSSTAGSGSSNSYRQYRIQIGEDGLIYLKGATLGAAIASELTYEANISFRKIGIA